MVLFADNFFSLKMCLYFSFQNAKFPQGTLIHLPEGKMLGPFVY